MSFIYHKHNWKTYIPWILCILIFFLTNIEANGLEQRSKLWTRVTVDGKTQDSFLYFLDIQFRYLLGDNPRFQENLNRAGIGYALTKKLGVWIGYAYVNHATSSQEQRIWQQLSYQFLNTNLFTLSSRTRFEQRWRNTSASEYQGTALRLRQQITLKFSNIINNQCAPLLYDEIFFNLNHPVWINPEALNQNRFFVGFQIELTKKMNFIIGYLNQYEVRRPKNEMNHVTYGEINFTFD